MKKFINNKFRILAIESSCDETSAAVLDVAVDTRRHLPITSILSNVVSSQVKLHAKYGGVYPELASREHVKNIIPVIKEALSICHADSNKNIIEETSQSNSDEILPPPFPKNNSEWRGQNDIQDIDYIAVTTGPGLIGSLLVGTETAKTLAYVFKKPVIAVNHLEGHIYSNFISSHCERSEAISSNSILDCHVANVPRNDNNLGIVQLNNNPKFPLIALIVSGGHTSLIYMKDHLSYKIIGETLDDAAGEAYDKVAAMLGLSYPGGPIVDALASKFKVKNAKLKVAVKNSKSLSNTRLFPRPLINQNNFNFSFSGLKTSVLYYLKKYKKPYSKKLIERVCYEFQEAVVETLVAKTLKAAKKYRVKSIIISGGVAANSRLRSAFESEINKLKIENCPPADETDKLKIGLFLPKKSLCTDNAAMIGAAAVYKILAGKVSNWYDINADANSEIS